MAFLAPAIFLSVTVFLIHMVFSRWIMQQRERIATLRAFGYRTHEITWDVLQVVSVWIAAGVLLGSLVGLQLARWLSELYKAFFRFPEVFHLPFRQL
jgi:putative ABC transport system permease protein